MTPVDANRQEMAGGVSRRVVLHRLAALFGRTSILSILLSSAPLIVGIRPAAAQTPADALAIASVVAGLFADSTRGDSAIQAMMSASIALTEIAIQKIEDLKEDLALVLNRLDQLVDDVDRMLRQERTRELQTDLYAVVEGYLEKLALRKHFPSDKAWKTPQMMADVKDLLRDLRRARRTLSVRPGTLGVG